jgi:hypothetical protein
MGLVVGVSIGVVALLVGALAGLGLATVIFAMKAEDQYDIWDEDSW